MLKNFVFFFIILAAIFVIGANRWLSVGGVNPNLFFVFFLLLASNARNLLFVLGLALSLLLFVFVFSPEWAPPFAFLLLLVLAFYFLKRILTGTALLDYLLLVLAGTLLFYFIPGIFHLSALPFAQIIGEALYNLALGVILWFIIGERIKIHA